MPERPAIFARALAVLAHEAHVDPVTTSFASLAPVLAGKDPRAVTVALSALFGEKLAARGAFWFPQRESPLGAMLGFPDVVLPIDPWPLAEAALGSVADLDERLRELTTSLGPRGEGGTDEAVTPARYAALFDPAMVQFHVLDDAKLARALAMNARDAVEAMREALVSRDMDPMLRDAAVEAWLEPLALLDGTIADQRGRAAETFVRLYATTSSTTAAEEGYWADVVFRAHPPEPRMLGVFRAPKPVTEATPPRLFLVDAAEAPALTLSVSASSTLALRRFPVADAALDLASTIFLSGT